MSQQKQQLDQNQDNKQQQQDPNALTEDDKRVYAQIMGSINRMDKKIKNVKQKANQSSESPASLKRTTVNQIAQKIIQAKQNSDIITKEDLVTDIQQTFEQVVVNVYTQNQQMKNKINSLVAIIKDQNRKLKEHKEREQKLIMENQKLTSQLLRIKDGKLIADHHSTGNKKGVQSPSQVNGGKNIKNISNRANTNENEDYDFWSMPNNQSNVKKRKEFVADSGLWINDKDIDKSVFITDQRAKK